MQNSLNLPDGKQKTKNKKPNNIYTTKSTSVIRFISTGR